MSHRRPNDRRAAGFVGELSPDCIATVGAVVTAGSVIGFIVRNTVLGSKVSDVEKSLDISHVDAERGFLSLPNVPGIQKTPHQTREVEIDARFKEDTAEVSQLVSRVGFSLYLIEVSDMAHSLSSC